MQAHRLQRNAPSLYGVALLAISAHLAAMDVGVAVGTLLADVAEDHVRVALRASELFVHTA